MLLNALGFLIFRASNNQKNLFRRDRNHPWVRQLKTLKTARGTELIVSGWWGIARHINYFGDMLLGLSWCLPCGFDHIVPYFYAIYFAVLLGEPFRLHGLSPPLLLIWHMPQGVELPLCLVVDTCRSLA